MAKVIVTFGSFESYTQGYEMTCFLAAA